MYGRVQALRRAAVVLGAFHRSLSPDHPMPAERMAALAELVKTPYWDKKYARAAIPPRHDAGEVVRLYREARRGDAALSVDRHQHARTLRARHLGLPVRRFARRHRADRCSDRVGAEQSLFLRAQRPGAARRRASGGSDRAVTPRRAAGTRSRADPDHAGAGADRHQRRQREPYPLLRAASPRSPKRPTPICSWRWLMATRAISPTPISLRRRPPSPAATIRRHDPQLAAGPRSAFPSDRPAGCAPMT